MIDEQIAPYKKDMLTRLKGDLYNSAVKICAGIIIGLRRCKHENTPGAALEYCPDAPEELEDSIITDFIKNSPGTPREELAAILHEYIM